MESTFAVAPRPALERLDLDPAHTSVEFAVRHLMVATVTGRFREVAGHVLYDRERPERSVVEAEVQAASLDTGAADRDAHLRSADFFDVERHPVLRLRSLRVEPNGADEGKLVAELTVRGVARPVEFAVVKEGESKDPWGIERVAFVATATLDRREFGLTWNAALETGGVLVGDKVKVTVRFQGIRRKAEA